MSLKPGRSETSGKDTCKGSEIPVSNERSVKLLSETKHVFAVSTSCVHVSVIDDNVAQLDQG